MTTKTPINDSSSDESSSSPNDQTPSNTIPGVEESKDDPDDTVNTLKSDEKYTFQTDLTEHAAALEKTMESAIIIGMSGNEILQTWVDAS